METAEGPVNFVQMHFQIVFVLLLLGIASTATATAGRWEHGHSNQPLN